MPAASSVQRARDYALSKTGGWVLPVGFDSHDGLQPLTREGSQLHPSRAWPFYTSQQIFCKVCEWFVSWQPWQQRILLCGVTNRCSSVQLESLATTLEPIFHRDFVTTLRKRYPSAPFRNAKKREDQKAPGKQSRSSSRASSRMTMKSSQNMKKVGMFSRDNTMDMSGIAEQREADCPSMSTAAGIVEGVRNTDSDKVVDPDPLLVTYVSRFVDGVMNGAIEQFINLPQIPSMDVLGNVVKDVADNEMGLQGVLQKNDEIAQSVEEPLTSASEPVLTGEVHTTESEPIVTRSEPNLLENGGIKRVERGRLRRMSTRLSLVSRAGSNMRRKRSVTTIARSMPRMPSMATLKGYIKQAVGMPLVNQHINIRQRINLLHSNPSSDALDNEHRVHVHRSTISQLSRNASRLNFFDQGPMQAELRPDQIRMRASFQGELRTGIVRRPVRVEDIYVPMQRMYKNIKWWGEAPHDGKTFTKPNRLLLKQQFKQQIEQIWEWMVSWEDGDKLALLVEVIKLCETEQLSYFTQCLGQRLQDRLDISWMTDKLLLLIFSYLPVDDVESCSRVCRRWRYLCCMDELWLLKCHELGLGHGIMNIESLILEANSDDQDIDWKLAFLELQRITRENRTSIPLPRQLTFEGPTPVGMRRVGGKFLHNREDNVTHLSATPRTSLGASSEREDELASLMTYAKTGGMQRGSRASSMQDLHSKLSSNRNVTKGASSKDGVEELAARKSKDTGEANKSLNKEDIVKSSSPTKSMKSPKSSKNVFDFAPPDAVSSKHMSEQHDGQSGSRVDGRKKKKKDSEGEVAADVRPQIFQARDILPLGKTPASSERPLPVETQVKIDQQAGHIASVVQVRRLQGHMDGVICVECDHRRLISSSMDRSIRIWDIRSGRGIHKLYGHKGGVCCLQFDNEELYSGSWDMSVQAWDIVHFKRLAVLSGHKGSISGLRMHAKVVLSSSHDGTVRVWCRATKSCLHVFEIHRVPILAMTSNDSHIITCGADRSLKISNLHDGKCIKTILGPHQAVDRITMQGQLVAGANKLGQVYFWNYKTGILEAGIQAHDLAVNSIWFHEKRFFTASSDATIREWDLSTMTCLRILQGHKGPVMDFKADDRYMVSCSTDGHIRIWELVQQMQSLSLGDSQDDIIRIQLIRQRQSY